jgi:hypothetical protein
MINQTIKSLEGPMPKRQPNKRNAQKARYFDANQKKEKNAHESCL